MMSQAPSWLAAVGLFALLPAVCEEVAFRGYILTGLEDGHRTRSAILLQALLFGFLHVLLSLFQQLFNATLLGIVLGLLAVRSRSLLPGIVFHFLNNAMAVSLAYWVHEPAVAGLTQVLYRNADEGLYRPAWVVTSLLVSAALLWYLWKVDGRRRPRIDDSDVVGVSGEPTLT
jgi:sodium transport system permease protein